MKTNTDKPMEWGKELHSLLKTRLGEEYEHQAIYFGLRKTLKQFISQALAAQREEIEFNAIRDAWIDMQKIIAMFGDKRIGDVVDAYKDKALVNYGKSLRNTDSKEIEKWCEHNRNIEGKYYRCLICNPTK